MCREWAGGFKLAFIVAAEAHCTAFAFAPGVQVARGDGLEGGGGCEDVCVQVADVWFFGGGGERGVTAVAFFWVFGEDGEADCDGKEDEEDEGEDCVCNEEDDA